MTLRLLSDWSPTAVLLIAAGLGLAAWLMYWRETKRLEGSLAWVLPSLRSVAILLIVLTLAEPIVESQVREGVPGKLTFLMDGSRSMALMDQPDPSSDETKRFDRALYGLSNPADGLIGQLAKSFDMSLESFGNDGARALLWESQSDARATRFKELQSSRTTDWSDSSAIGPALRDVADSFSNPLGKSQPQQVLVLLSDGQSNQGESPLAAAQALADLNVPIFCVGYGAATQTEDLAILSALAPGRVYRTDVLRGTIQVAEHLAPGKKYSTEIVYEGQVLWQSEFISMGMDQREIEFSMPVPLLLEAASQSLPAGVTFATLPVKLDVHVSYANDQNLQNNTTALFTSVAAQKSKILIVDGRSRWETRYLKNLFSRDPAWDVTSVIDTGYSLEPSPSGFPTSRNALFQFNAVILGDLPSNRLDTNQLQWLREFVELNAGGLIVIDGARHHLHDAAYAPLHELLPIQWVQDIGSARSALPKQVVLTEAGRVLNALDLTTHSLTLTADAESDTKSESHFSDNSAANDLQWAALPAVNFLAQVKAAVGSEVLALADSGIDKTPLLVTRQFGAGRVLYLASDETWRWRYKVADRFHSRLWNQLVRWIMRTPLSIQGEFVSLDTGAATYRLGQTVDVRCQLHASSGNATVGRMVTAIVRRGGEIVTRISLAESATIPGAYAASADLQDAGDYSVQIEADGFSQSALELESKFSIIAPRSSEMLQTHCNESLLMKISEISGGKYVQEEQIASLAELLQPMSGGRITQSATIIWQSYGWFCTAMLLLIAEWILRKRSGLV